MQISDLTVGTKLELEINKKLDDRQNLILVSKFEWAQDESTFFIAAPIYKGVFYPIHEGQKIAIYTIVEKELYRFEGIVRERIQKDNIRFLKLEVLSSFQKIQRREFFRFDCLLPVQFRVINDDKIEEGEEKYQSSFTKNLSGGGICLKLIDRLEINTKVKCRLQIRPDEYVEFVGEVVRIESIGQGQKFNFEAGIRFTDISERDREAIIGYIFEQQRKLRKRGFRDKR